MHATIEKAFRHKKVYTTREWELIIGFARKQNPLFIVKRRYHNDVHDLKALSRFVKNRSKNTLNEAVQWMKIKWMRFEKSRLYIIQYKYSIKSDSFMELNTLIARGRPTLLANLSLAPAYNRRLSISVPKKNDLMSLIESGIIPQEHAPFYHDLPSNAKCRDRLPQPDATEETDDDV